MKTTTNHRRLAVLAVGFGGIAIGGAIVAAIALSTTGCSSHQAAAQPTGDNRPVGSAESEAPDGSTSAIHADANVITVDTIRPKRNPKGFVRSVTPPAYVEGVYTADLMAHVPGAVKSIQKNIGDPVTEGEVLVELDAPDLVQELAQKTAGVHLAEQDYKAAQVNLIVAEAAAKSARALIKESKAAEERSRAWKRFKEQEYNRYEVLAQRDAVVANILSEKLRDMEAAAADYQAAQAATETATAKADEFSAKVEAARVDIDVKKAKVSAAEADRDYAQSMVNYTKIHAPFNGLIVSRKVDPGSFVQNASTGNPSSMLRVVRTDWVTIVIWVPEKDAPFVNKNTEAAVYLDALGKQPIRTHVTRYSHWLDPEKSRDLRVEIDLENKDGRLTPGMYGLATLLLEDFSKSLLVPTSAVVTTGDQSYIVEVSKGRAVRVPVQKQYEDGVQAKIVKRVLSTDVKTGAKGETYQDLTEEDEIVRSGQGELADGQPVKAVATDW